MILFNYAKNKIPNKANKINEQVSKPQINNNQPKREEQISKPSERSSDEEEITM